MQGPYCVWSPTSWLADAASVCCMVKRRSLSTGLQESRPSGFRGWRSVLEVDQSQAIGLVFCHHVADSKIFAALGRFLSDRFFRSINQKPISGEFPFLKQSVFPLFRRGKTDWMALSVFPVEKFQAWSIHAVLCKNLNHTLGLARVD